MQGEQGFSLIEVVLAVGIIGCGVLCLLGLFTPILSQVRDLEAMSEFEDVKRKVDTFIQMRSFDEIYNMTKKEETFYFYEDCDGKQEVCNIFDEAQGSSKIIKAQLFPSKMTDIMSCGPLDYDKSYFAIWVEINKGGQSRENQSKGRNYVVIKNR